MGIDHVQIDCKSETQWLRFENRNIRGGVFLTKGVNKIEIDIWEKIKNGKWTLHLIKTGIIKILTEDNTSKKETQKVKIDKSEKEVVKKNAVTANINKITNVSELEEMMDNASKSTKLKIAKRIKELVDNE